jgi:plasmid maintenance system antidote protein VapI
MSKARRIFAVRPGEILKTEFMESMGVSAYALAKALNFPLHARSLHLPRTKTINNRHSTISNSFCDLRAAVVK